MYMRVRYLVYWVLMGRPSRHLGAPRRHLAADRRRPQRPPPVPRRRPDRQGRAGGGAVRQTRPDHRPRRLAGGGGGGRLPIAVRRRIRLPPDERPARRVVLTHAPLDRAQHQGARLHLRPGPGHRPPDAPPGRQGRPVDVRARPAGHPRWHPGDRADLPAVRRRPRPAQAPPPPAQGPAPFSPTYPPTRPASIRSSSWTGGPPTGHPARKALRFYAQAITEPYPTCSNTPLTKRSRKLGLERAQGAVRNNGLQT